MDKNHTKDFDEQNFYDRAQSKNYIFDSEQEEQDFKNQLVNNETIQRWIESAF